MVLDSLSVLDETCKRCVFCGFMDSWEATEQLEHIRGHMHLGVSCVHGCEGTDYSDCIRGILEMGVFCRDDCECTEHLESGEVMDNFCVLANWCALWRLRWRH